MPRIPVMRPVMTNGVKSSHLSLVSHFFTFCLSTGRRTRSHKTVIESRSRMMGYIKKKATAMVNTNYSRVSLDLRGAIHRIL
jgi:hypothetical protein